MKFILIKDIMPNLEQQNRDEIIKEVFNILSFVDSKLSDMLTSNINIWSTKELSQILEFIKTWSLKPIYDFLEDKKQEYLTMISEIKWKKRLSNLNDIKMREKLELEEEKEEIENIEFNF